jgi:hypothetical protein
MDYTSFHGLYKFLDLSFTAFPRETQSLITVLFQGNSGPALLTICPPQLSLDQSQGLAGCEKRPSVMLRERDFFECCRKVPLITNELSARKWPKIQKNHRL